MLLLIFSSIFKWQEKVIIQLWSAFVIDFNDFVAICQRSFDFLFISFHFNSIYFMQTWMKWLRLFICLCMCSLFLLPFSLVAYRFSVNFERRISLINHIHHIPQSAFRECKRDRRIKCWTFKPSEMCINMFLGFLLSTICEMCMLTTQCLPPMKSTPRKTRTKTHTHTSHLERTSENWLSSFCELLHRILWPTFTHARMHACHQPMMRFVDADFLRLHFWYALCNFLPSQIASFTC